MTGAFKIEPMGKLRDPGKIQLWSPLGIIALFILCLAVTLLLIQLMQNLFLTKTALKIPYVQNGCTSLGFSKSVKWYDKI